MNKKFWITKIIGFSILAIGFAALLAYVVMLLWNGVLAQVVTVSTISFYQAIGLLVLSKILFGGFPSGKNHCNQCGGGGHWKNQLKEKWHTMSPEERDQMKQEWRNRCRTWGRSSQTSASEKNSSTE